MPRGNTPRQPSRSGRTKARAGRRSRLCLVVLSQLASAGNASPPKSDFEEKTGSSILSCPIACGRLSRVWIECIPE